MPLNILLLRAFSSFYTGQPSNKFFRLALSLAKDKILQYDNSTREET